MSPRHLPKERVKVDNLWPTLRRMWHYLGTRKWTLIVVLILVITSSALSLIGPYLLGTMIDDFLDVTTKRSFIYSLSLLASVYLISIVTGYVQQFLMITLSQETVFEMRRELFTHLHTLPLKYFDEHQDGDIMSRLTNDIENVSQTLNTAVIQVFSSVLTLAGTLIVMITLSLPLTFVTLFIIPVLYFGMKWLTKRTRVYFKQQAKDLGDLFGFIEESISGLAVIKILSQEAAFQKQFIEKNEQLRESGYKAQVYSGFIPKFMNMLNNMSFAILTFVGALLAITQAVSVGMIVTFTQYARQFTRPLSDLANQFNGLLSAVAGAERVFEILDEQPDYTHAHNESFDTVKGDVSFQHVSFKYHNEWILKDVSLHAKPGETIALVGPTGAGKTTILNLLMRFYLPDQGDILLDGQNILTLSEDQLRRPLAFVLQDPYLFEASIKDNLLFGKPEATEAEWLEAAKLANADSFIRHLPNGYDTLLREDGKGISQGERQLLSIARAILRDPAVLILDEATSSIDTVTEVKIQQALARLMAGRTSIVIAHRLNTIESADCIYVLNNGEVIEFGRHHDLLKRQGFYYQLYRHGFNDA
ncbi:putative ABC transporter ATP-binding protein YfiC [Halolactibacillus miurensis]|uniref:ABC transporter ATP-binding protein YfiC n=1 Tax=Halolactibacillus miurensis TaxID=306541 RepID=A0A1I6ST45_9BACI|nr:ABC transporter ATP-binding protein [Halolactibacillus miurensis]GEM04219.1 putative ABC transporter ATP-binding protein YfiC [Halolactibacillus miurensis]SFS80113.1 ATP-binding cassette, subfamily B [Halolactibacillus miurensis]